jgi:hypothetical protein
MSVEKKSEAIRVKTYDKMPTKYRKKYIKEEDEAQNKSKK